MLITLTKKELLDNLLSFRFIVSSVIVICIMILGTTVLMQDYVLKRDSYTQNMRAHRKTVEQDIDNYLMLMFSGVGANRPPAPLQIFYSGVEKNPNRATMIFPFFKPRFMGELNINPVFPLFPSVDLLFIVSIVMSLIAFVFSYDAVCGERERGTLKLLMSYSIPRDIIIMAKWIGGYISLIIPFIIGVIVCSIILFAYPNVKIPGEEWVAFSLTILISLLFIGVMYSVGLFISVWAKRSATSISVLLFLWVVFVLVIPNSVPFLVDKISPIDSPSTVMNQIKHETGGTLEGMLEDLTKSFEDVTGIKVSEIDFSDLPGMDEEEGGEGGEQQQAAASQQQSSGGGSSGGGGGSSQIPEGVDMSQITAIAGEITDSDLRDIQLRGCERWVSSKLKDEMGMTLDDARKMAKDYGVDVDVNAILRECESRKQELMALKNKNITEAQQLAQSSNKPQLTPPPAKLPEPKPKQQPAKKKTIKAQDIFKEFMKLPEDRRNKFFDGLYMTFLRMNEDNSSTSERIEGRYSKEVDKQVRLTKNLSRISPVSSYIYAVTDLSNTGIERERDLKEYLWQYQSQLLEFLKNKIEADPSAKTHKVFEVFREAPYEPDEIPRFNYKPISLNERFSFVIIDILVLFIFAIVFFFAAYISFIKTEIID